MDMIIVGWITRSGECALDGICRICGDAGRFLSILPEALLEFAHRWSGPTVGAKGKPPSLSK